MRGTVVRLSSGVGRAHLVVSLLGLRGIEEWRNSVRSMGTEDCVSELKLNARGILYPARSISNIFATACQAPEQIDLERKSDNFAKQLCKLCRLRCL